MKDSFFLHGEEVRAAPYHYREGGIDGIYLLNGFTIEQRDGDEFVSIKDVDGLHRAIGRHIVLHRKALRPTEVRFLRKAMDLTQATLAEKLGTTSQTVARWEKGEVEIPGAPEKLLRVLFLLTVMSEEEMKLLRQLLLDRLEQLDELDELKSPKAEFALSDHHWSEKLAA